MTNTPLNPDAERQCVELLLEYRGTPMHRLYEYPHRDNDSDRYIANAKSLLKKILAVAQPVVISVPGVYDLGSSEPEGVYQVVECDDLGQPCVRDDESNYEPSWGKTKDGTSWKGYKDGKAYLSWAELVRRYGPLTEVKDA